MTVSVIIPAYNEEGTIDILLKQVKAVRLSEADISEIIIVNDGSTDGTAMVLGKYRKDPSVKIFNLEKNIGKTSALALGIKKATGDIIIIQDADLEYNPIEYPNLIAPILADKASVVYGSRFKGSIRNMLFINRLANVISNFTFNLLFPAKITDINTCYKVFKKDVIKSIPITSKDFTFETEITVKLVNKGYSILEVPIRYIARSKKDGKKINRLYAWHMYWGIIKYRRPNCEK